MVEPGHPLQRGDFYRPLGLPRGATMDQFCPVQTIDRFRQGVVSDVSFTAYRARNVDFVEMLAVAKGDVLGTLVGMVDQSCITLRLSCPQHLFWSIEHEVGVQGTAHPPAYDPTRKEIDHKGHIQPALPGREVGDSGTQS